MKILISEQQLKRIISEQPESRFTMLGITDKERADVLNKPKLGPGLSGDDIMDVVSGMVDVIPGIGNLVSAGIDITHGISYVVRYFFAKSMEDKVEMSVMALLTFGTSFVPVGGNAANMVIRGELKALLRKTPAEILKIAKDMGIIKGGIFNLSKEVWKYSLLIALVKIFRSKIDDVLGSVSKTLASLSNKSQDLRPYLDNYIKDIKDLQNIYRA